MKEPLFFSKANNSSSVPAVCELSHCHVPSSPGQAPVLKLFPLFQLMLMWLWESHRKCWSEPHEGPLPLQVGSYLHFWLDWIVEGNVNSFQFWEISSVALGRILWFEKNKYFVWIPTCHFNCVTVYQRHWDTGYPPRRARFVEQMVVELLSLVLFVTVSAMQSRGDYSHVKWGGRDGWERNAHDEWKVKEDGGLCRSPASPEQGWGIDI